LSQQGAAVFGVDFSQEMLAEAERKNVLAGRLALAEAGFLPFRDAVADVTLCSFAAGYFQDLRNAICEMARIVKPGGSVILSDLHPAAISAGWTRSFRADACTYEISHFNPSVHDLRNAGQNTDLQLRMEFESPFGEPERALFRAGGKEHTFAEICSIPALWIGIWKRQ
jgi:malonyl-CoA O-methyltransferase